MEFHGIPPFRAWCKKSHGNPPVPSGITFIYIIYITLKTTQRVVMTTEPQV
jgi:hypothetical protein